MSVLDLYRPYEQSNQTGELPAAIELDESQRFVVVETWNMTSDELSFGQGLLPPRRAKARVRAMVRKSLEQSLQQHADVWAKLAER